ncbi:hypothetical protein GCM10011416_10980 [Polaribacter pacificus]|uniref:CarboxypepD_reg-like domain-containing protein n=1 Tax=Polaribacter pacificus TaxID=1775173 RepID=A0A917HY49_9FLAO|nr:carboxypeptidase-like regulatory domain-containing protein [Polaribacter pacificus]GGG95286.1 hypothetical protein GCM10011416_10980 [Polaribacter pacificus]
MRKALFISLFFISIISYAQTRISGKIVDKENTPLEGASVYLNNTTVGVSTNTEGEFYFTVDDGSYDLIVSYLGFKTIQYSLVTSSYKETLLFKLEESDNVLNEVVITKTKYDDTWRFNLNQFTENFLGRTLIAADCELMNPKTLHFEFDQKTNTLTAVAREPLKIKNKGLGYLITFDLVHFSLGLHTVNYYGYTKYENLKGSKRKQRKWDENRKKAYLGSKMHFVRSLIAGNTKEEGYNINQFRRELNPERPTDQEIAKARELIKLSNINTFDYRFKTEPETMIDSAMVVLQKVSLPKHKNYLYKQGVPLNDIRQKEGNNMILSFDNYLSIIYTKEAEEKNYIMGLFGKKREPLNVQTSEMTMLVKKAILDPSGEIINPLDVFYEGYWAFEQFADALPLNYTLPIK